MLLQATKNDGRIECLLCPHFCKIAEGKTGICGVRKNKGGTAELLTHGVISGYALDPIEKKPLYHFFPGTNILSIGSYGCNLRCDFCQNYNISQRTSVDFSNKIDTDRIISDAQVAMNNIGIAFTYNEPVIWFEFVREVATNAKARGLRTVMVTNGYVNREPLDEIIEFTDAFNIDLKSFNDEFYRRLTGSSLEPVKKAIRQVSASGRHLEITTLIIPGRNDDPEEMKNEAEWIAGELGKSTPLHLSRYFPMYMREDPPTPPETIKILSETASKYLDYVYTGNITMEEGQNTKCPTCGTVVTKRSGYTVKHRNLDKKGNCKVCGTNIYRNFTSFSSQSQN
jgi:pyruvate formate lyase activating enzyme